MNTTNERCFSMYQTPYNPNFQGYYREGTKKILRKQLRQDSNRLSFGILAFVLLATILFSTFIITLQILGYPFRGGDLTAGLDEEMYFLLNCLYYLIAGFLPFGLILYLSNQDPNVVVPTRKVKFSTFISCIFAGSTLCLLANYPTNYICALIETFGLNTAIPESHIPQTIYGIILYYIYVGIIPPLVEEFIFRGVILSRLQKYGNGFAIFASSLLFALYHGNIMQLIFAFICGFVLGFVTIRTKNIFIPIIIHLINNSISVTGELLYEYCYENFANMISSAIILSLFALGAISLIYLIIKRKYFFKHDDDAPVCELSLSSKLANLVFNPGFIGLLIFYVSASVTFLMS